MIDAGQFYRQIGRTGINYGPAFRMVTRVANDDTMAMLRCATCIIDVLDVKRRDLQAVISPSL